MRRILIPSLAVLALIVAGCGANGQLRPPPPSPEEVVGKVDSQTLTVEEVEKHLSPPDPVVGFGSYVNPRRQALDAAIRVKLFAREAKKQGLRTSSNETSGIIEAQMVQSLVQQELERRDFQRKVSEAEAKRYYERRQELFNGDRLQSVTLKTIVVEDPVFAERLLDQVKKTTDEDFVRLAQKYSVDETSRSRGAFFAVLERGRRGPFVKGDTNIGDETKGVGWSLRKPGQVGLARGSEGRYYVLRASKVEVASRPLDKQLVPFVKGIASEEHRDRVLEDLEARLQKEARITVEESVLYRIPVPTW